MELKQGYKRTEVGVIPEDWEIKKIGEISEVGRGRVISHREISASLYSMYPVYSSQTFNDGIMGYIDTYDFEGEYITWTTDGVNAGTVFYRNGRFNCTNVCGTIKLRKHNSLFVSKVLGILAKRYVSKNLANPKLMNDIVKQILVFLPPILYEQQAIAAAIGDVEALITSLDRLIAKKCDIKKAAMQQLLAGKTRLPGFSEEWKLKKLGEIFQFLNTANNSRSDLSENGEVKYIHYGDIHMKWRSFLNCSSDELPLIQRDKVRNMPFLEDGDLVMADASEDYDGIGISVEVKNATGKKVVAGLHTFLLRGDKEVLADGFKGYLQYIPAVKDSLKRAATGISVYGISKNNVRNISICLPDIAEQRAIATVLSDMDAEIAALEEKRDKTRALKQGMMQELLTGKTRLI